MTIKYLIDNFDKFLDFKVTVNGRVLNIRTLSKKLSFIVIESCGTKIQIGIRSSNVPKKFDIVRCFGDVKYSQTQEKTVWCENPEIISSCEGELPNFTGLSDGKLKTEKRYLDILTNFKIRDNLIFRSKLIQNLRNRLSEEGFIEIETPILSNIPSGANATPFVTKSEALNENFYLRIATEIPLKKAIVAGFERVFEIGKIFRNEGIDKTHNPEFTSIELYGAYYSLDDMKNLIILFLKEYGITEFDTIEYDELVAKHGENFDEFLIKPTFVCGQPIEQTPLCGKRHDGKANRFELFINGFEIANAYQEITNWQEQQSRFENHLEKDDGLCEALKYGCPPMAGMGIGIDRLVMALTNTENIADVIFFPTKRN